MYNGLLLGYRMLLHNGKLLLLHRLLLHRLMLHGLPQQRLLLHRLLLYRLLLQNMMLLQNWLLLQNLLLLAHRLLLLVNRRLLHLHLIHFALRRYVRQLLRRSLGGRKLPLWRNRLDVNGADWVDNL